MRVLLLILFVAMTACSSVPSDKNAPLLRNMSKERIYSPRPISSPNLAVVEITSGHDGQFYTLKDAAKYSRSLGYEFFTFYKSRESENVFIMYMYKTKTELEKEHKDPVIYVVEDIMQASGYFPEGAA